MPVTCVGLEENIRMPFKDHFPDGRNGAVANRPSKQTSKQRSRVWHNQGRSLTASDAIPGLRILGPRIEGPRIEETYDPKSYNNPGCKD